MKYSFDADKVKDECVLWIREYFEENGPTCNAIVGISGGKDSTVVAALCAEALGQERVIGVLLPEGVQGDICDSYQVIETLGIRSCKINIKPIVDAAIENLKLSGLSHISEDTKINLPARIRMSMLFAVSQSSNGRVANTCNLSEDWVGYSTLFGDGAGQFAPLAGLTVTEVKAIGYALGLPSNLIEKTPSDGLSGQTDEDRLGFTYKEIDTYLRTGECASSTVKDMIDLKHRKNLFKLCPMPKFDAGTPFYADTLSQMIMWLRKCSD